MGAFCKEVKSNENQTSKIPISNSTLENKARKKQGQLEISQSETSPKIYKFRETDIRLKQIKNQLKLKEKHSNSMHSKSFSVSGSRKSARNIKRLSLNVSQLVDTPTASKKKKVSKTNVERELNNLVEKKRSRSASEKKYICQKPPRQSASKFDVFEFTDEEINGDDHSNRLSTITKNNIDQNLAKKIRTNSVYLTNLKKNCQILSISANNSPLMRTISANVDMKQLEKKRKLVLNSSLTHLADIGSNCEGSNNSYSGLSTNSNPNSNESFVFDDNYEFSNESKTTEKY